MQTIFNKHIFLSFFTTFSLFLSTVEAGTLQPFGVNNIYSSVANRAQSADYTFSFIPDTTIPVGGLVRVYFPNQFDSGLGIISTPKCSVPCTLSANRVDFTLTEEKLAGYPMNVTIKQVMNPNIKGGTGNFQIQTLWGVNVLDENLIFDVLGIADSVGTLTSTIVSVASSGLSNAGETTRYTFQFKVSQLIPAQSYIKFTISDPDFGLTNFPACNAYAINGKTIEGKFFCETSGRDILVRGLKADIPSGQDVGISVAMINPKFSQTTDSFTIALLRDGTNVIYNVRSNIAGVTITPGLITSISLTPVDSTVIQSRKKVMDYIFNFQLKNSLRNTSVIALEFPPSFELDKSANGLLYVRFGLEDISEHSTVGLSVDANNVLRLTNFHEFEKPSLISLYLRVTNPNNIGETTPVNIRSYLDQIQTILVDQDTVSAYTVIQDSPSPTTHTITSSIVNGNELQGSIIFQVNPSVTIPQAGKIQIKVPDGFTLGTIIASSCQVTNPVGGFVNAAQCTSAGNTITLTFPNTISFPLGTLRRFSLNNLITTPFTNGTYLFDITSFLSDGTTVIESWTDYLTVQPVVFAAPASVVSLDRVVGVKTMLTASFTTLVSIPAGIFQHKASDTKGLIELEFGTNLGNDLGYGTTTTTEIPCYVNAGLLPISGSVTCVLIPGAKPLIRVDNFQEVSESTYVSVSFPAVLKNPAATTYSVKMKTIKLANRVRTEINSNTYTLSSTAPIVAAPYTSTGSYSLTSLLVSTSTSITFTPRLRTASITGVSVIIIELPMYDVGWITSSTSIGCRINNQVYSCVGYYGADWITIPYSTGNTFSDGTTITISNLKVPRYSNVNVGGIKVRFINTANRHLEYCSMDPLPAATVPTMNQATLIVDKKNRGAVNVAYSFVFVPQNDIPEDASIIISFPTGYNLLSSSPAVSFSSSNLVPVSSGQKVVFSASIGSLTISGFKTIPAFTSFSILVSGVKNPTSLTQSQPWRVQVFLNLGLMIYHDNFDQFVFTQLQSANSITYNSISASPLNAGDEANYILNFVPATQIPIGGQIRIRFPTENYDTLPSPPSCRISGGVTTFSSCTLSGTTFTIVLDSQYTTGGLIIQIDNIRNPDRGTTDPFLIQTFYDGVMLDNTDTTTNTGRTVTIAGEGTPIQIQQLSFNPKNEGEQASYTFSFVTSNPIESTMEIVIVFPSVYDKTLGPAIACKATNGLLGDLICTVSDRKVIISGFQTYLPDTTSPVIINLYGVINPNSEADTGQFKIGTRVVGNQAYVDYNSAVGTLTMSTAPGWAVLYDITPTNLYTRLDATYQFNFTAIASIPKTSSSGAIQIDFPSEFIIPDGEGNCDTTTTDFSPVVTCSFSRNTLSISGQTQDYSGNVGLVVRNIQNPIEKGTAKNILLKTYDGLNSLILERSFKNLDPFFFTYQYPGPLIYINKDETITAIRGTQTNDLYVTLDFPCALNLTLKPSTPGFSVIPYGIQLSLGQTKAKFRVSVPESFPEGTYEIQWETLGDTIPRYYTPIKNTPVIVIAKTSMTIQAPTINAIPFGGNSLPSSFTVENGPDIEIQITVNFLVTYPGISLSTNLLNFTAGTTSASFTIYSSSDSSQRVQKGELVLSLTGKNQYIYSLSTTSLQFQITDPDLSVPFISDLSVINITKNSAAITLKTSEVCMVYYMLALRGTVEPPLSEVISKGPAPHATTMSQYGVVQVMPSDTEIDILFENLVAETPYVIYVFVLDGGDNTRAPYSKVFQTLNRDNGVTFSLKFDEFDLNQAEKNLIINSISFILSLWPGKLQEQKYATTFSNRLLAEIDLEDSQKSLSFLGTDEPKPTAIVPVKSQGRMLQEVFILMNLQIAATPESPDYPSPKTLALSLNGKGTLIKARLPDADVTYRVEAFEYLRYQPAFPTAPMILETSYGWATFSAKLSNYGVVFVSCVKDDEDHGRPSPYQIILGYDNRNIDVPSANVEISEPYKSYTMNVTNLSPLTNYTAYIVGGSAHPGYPDPMDDKDIVIIKFETRPSKPRARLNIKGQSIISVTCGVLISVLSFWFLI